MITILNKEELYKKIEKVIKYNNVFSEKKLSGSKIYYSILDMIANNKIIDLLILDEDKDYVEINFLHSSKNRSYELILYRKIFETRKTILEINFNDTDLDFIEKYRINYFMTIRNEFQNPRLDFFRNNIRSLPDANETRKKYNRIKNILNKFKCNFPVGKNLNYLVIDRKLKDFELNPNVFFKSFLANNIYSNLDKEYFKSILTLNAHDSRIETIWIYYKDFLKEMNFNKKEDIDIFDNYINEVKEHLNLSEIEVIFDFKYKCINLMFETGLEYPNHKVFIKINKNEKNEYLLEKELYKYSSLYNVDYIKIDDVLLNNYIENREEVIQLVKLFDY